MYSSCFFWQCTADEHANIGAAFESDRPDLVPPIALSAMKLVAIEGTYNMFFCQMVKRQRLAIN